MPRNASGTYTLPTGNPVVSGTLIEADWANTTLNDIANELTDSLSRSGEGGMLAPFRLADGLQASPGIAWLNEPSTGFYREGSGEMWGVVGGAQILQYTATGVLVPAGKTLTANGGTTTTTLTTSGAATLASASVTGNLSVGGTLTLTGGLTLNGNVTVGDSSADTLTINSTITSNLIFTDNTYDIGASGATRPRHLYLAGNGVIGGTLGVSGVLTASGGVTGNLTGNVTGNVTGNISGGTVAGTTGTFSSNVTVGGTLGVTGATTLSSTLGVTGAITASGGVSGNVTGNLTGNVTGSISGGTVAGSTGAFSSNVTVGGTLGVTGVATLTANPVLSGGTANGVLYLDGSKVATSGSALVFNGTHLLLGTTTVAYSGTLLNIGNTSDSQNGVQIQTSTTGVGYVLFGDGAGADAFRGEINYAHSSDSMAFKTSGAEGMRLTSTGLGIGTSSPVARLQVKTQTNANAAFQNSTSVAGGVKINCFNDAGSASSPFELDGSTLQFNIASVERMRLDTSGNLGIGTTSPGAKLSVDGSAIFNDSGANVDFRIEGDTDANLFFVDASTDRIGVGTSSPASKLNMVGSSTALLSNQTSAYAPSANSAATALILQNDSNTAGSYSALEFWSRNAASNVNIAYIASPSTSTNDSGTLVFGRRTGTATSAESMRIDSAGNLGLGVTPSASWFASAKAMQIGSYVAPYMGLAQQTTTTCDGYMLWGARLSGDRAFQYTTTGDAVCAYRQNAGTHNWFTAPSGTAGNTITFTTAMTLDADGDLVVGGTSANVYGANRAITVNAATNQNCIYEYTINGTSTGYFGGSSTATWVASKTNIPLILYTNDTERARITSGGDLLVGTTSGQVAATVVAFRSSAATSCVGAWNSATSGDNLFVDFNTEATATLRGSIDYNRAGGLVRYNITSDYRAKDIIGPLQNVGETIDGLKVYEGMMKGATESRPMLIAHEAQEYAPYAVSGVKDEVNEDGTPKYQQIDVSSLVPLLLAEIQSLRARVAALEAA